MNLVIGASTYADRELKPFLSSLDRVSDCSCVLVAPPDGPRHPVCSRWPVIMREIMAREDAEFIFVTDVRDVVFQADPFAWDVPDLAVFCESQRMTIGSCPYNSMWIRRYYGMEVYENLSAESIICAGTVFGRRSAVIDWIACLAGELDRLVYGNVTGPDQAAHNVLIRAGIVGATVYELFTGPVATVGYCRPEDLNVVDGALRNNDGSIPPVVHQYDRSPMLCRELAALQS